MAAAEPRRVGPWTLERHIGSGSFAVVWKARHVTSGEVMAVKEISLDKLNDKLKQSLASEVGILRETVHENIVQLHDVMEVGNRLYLVMEYCAGGDLAAYLAKHKRVSEETARGLMRQLAAGLKRLWSHHLVHRDLKPQNLLLSSRSPDATLKIADFGFARPLLPQGLAETLCGSPLYMAPEILNFHRYDAKADLWSVGTILFELVTGRPPFSGNNHVHLLRNIERSEARLPDAVRDALSPAAVHIISQLLRRNPVERISFDEFFKHPFLSPSGLQYPSAHSATTASHTTPTSASQNSSTSSTHATHSGASADNLALGSQMDAARGLGSPVLQPGMRTSLNTAMGMALPSARFVASPPIFQPERQQQAAVLTESLASQARQQPVGDSLIEEDDYVIVDPAPSSQASSQTSRSSVLRHHSGPSAPTMPPRDRQVLHHPLAPPVDDRGAGAWAAAAAPQQARGTLGAVAAYPSRDALLRVARLMDGLAHERAAQGQFAAALSLYLLALQILQAALEQAVKHPGHTTPAGSTGDASSITGDMREVALHAEQAAAGAPAGGELPDAWELLYSAALMLARSAAVDELLGDHAKCVQDYARAGTLLHFLALEAPQLALHPALELDEGDRLRLHKYTSSIAARHAAVVALSTGQP